jgi:hypothetical protein
LSSLNIDINLEGAEMKRALLIGGSVVIVTAVAALIYWRHQPTEQKTEAAAEESNDTALTVKAVSGSSSVVVGEYRQFVAEQNGKEVEVEWRVSNSQLACVDETGILVGTQPGLLNVVATYKGISGQARVQVVSSSPDANNSNVETKTGEGRKSACRSRADVEGAREAEQKKAVTVKYIVFYPLSLPVDGELVPGESLAERRRRLIEKAVEKKGIPEDCKIIDVKNGYSGSLRGVGGRYDLICYETVTIPASESQGIPSDSIIPCGYSDRAVAAMAKDLWEKKDSQNCPVVYHTVNAYYNESRQNGRYTTDYNKYHSTSTNYRTR